MRVFASQMSKSVSQSVRIFVNGADLAKVTTTPDERC